MTEKCAAVDWSSVMPDLDQVFASPVLSRTASRAIAIVRKKFDTAFPGIELYRYVATGEHSEKLTKWAMDSSSGLANAKQKNGHPYTRSSVTMNGWVDQAGLDALYFVAHGKFPKSAVERGLQYRIHRDTYRAVRNPVAGMMAWGMEVFRTQLHAEYMLLI